MLNLRFINCNLRFSSIIVNIIVIKVMWEVAWACDARSWRHGGQADRAVTAAAPISSLGFRRAVRVAIQLLQFSPNLALLDSVRGLVKMGRGALFTLRVVLTPTFPRFAIMPEPISTTLLIFRQILYVHALKISGFLPFSFTFPPVAV